ncbi:dihydrodipicolinate synthase family protein [Mesorhizobium sp. M5C.F.Ca.IN.020.29.1.1]|uniref:dihydrodipicolinate synthase family protein n=1 Tax=Mesorhizobium sp. M5C.F.Ca.IN.020.29.1.1 TaxID=2496770 RepID=UPI000FCBA59F|nr:dihydrodipicolinate synthase family protein [Mesorhizobium sp. M5C.F.Ca.IN.020.29.1.1]RUV53564.1 dihydrodipicolinate synthase family protein [Mesorhizobium sp. M5C.F.Ca.IN.020.29.1.1]
MANWAGVFPAVTTKLNEKGDLDLAATQSSIERLIRGGVSGVIVLPMLGENASLTPDEKEKVIRAAKEVVSGRVPLLSGLAEISSDSAVDTARKFQSFGAEGLMAFPSIAYKSDARETSAWYRNLAAGCDLPIMIYNNPIAYGVDVAPEILRTLEDVDQIVCIKEESGDIRRVTDLYNAFGDRFAVFCGVDDLILESLALGVTGWVSGMTNAWPEECVRIFDLGRAEKFAEARELYRIMTPAFHLDTSVKLVQYIKLAEHLVCGAPEWTRAPRLPLVGDERERVVSIIEQTIATLNERYSRAA